MKQLSIVRSLIVLTLIILALTPTYSQTEIIFGYDNAGNRTSRVIEPKDIIIDSIVIPDTSQSEAIILNTENNNINSGLAETEVFPNPNNGEFFVRFNALVDLENTSIIIESMLGERIYQLESVEQLNKIDIKSREVGVYLITVISGQKKESWKIIKY